jgi:Rrf2 family protein
MVMTLEADYAVRIVDALSRSAQHRGARSISEETKVPLRFALKILRKLVAGGIIVSFKGAHGGYSLARGADSITLYGKTPGDFCPDTAGHGVPAARRRLGRHP